MAPASVRIVLAAIVASAVAPVATTASIDRATCVEGPGLATAMTAIEIDDGLRRQVAVATAAAVFATASALAAPQDRIEIAPLTIAAPPPITASVWRVAPKTSPPIVDARA
jgi:hypothetical protein